MTHNEKFFFKWLNFFTYLNKWRSNTGWNFNEKYKCANQGILNFKFSSEIFYKTIFLTPIMCISFLYHSSNVLDFRCGTHDFEIAASQTKAK